MQTMEAIIFANGVLDGVRRHAREQRDRWGAEAVGFMAQKSVDGPVSTLVRLNNHSPDPQRTFFVEPWEQFQAEMALKRAGYRISGVYHSHPTGEAHFSRTDEDTARPGELMLIYSVAFDEFGLWRECQGRLEPVTIS